MGMRRVFECGGIADKGNGPRACVARKALRFASRQTVVMRAWGDQVGEDLLVSRLMEQVECGAWLPSLCARRFVR